MHRLRRRADEFDFAALADFSEMRVLGEETVAGMNSVDISHLGRAHDAIDFQITFIARCGADADRFVRQLDMERIDVRFGINRQRANAEFFASANDAQRDLTAISNQDFFEHVPLPRVGGSINYRTRKSTWPNCTGLLFSATTSATTPLVSALISFITFIASIMQTTVSSVTDFPTSTKGAPSGDRAR